MYKEIIIFIFPKNVFLQFFLKENESDLEPWSEPHSILKHVAVMH